MKTKVSKAEVVDCVRDYAENYLMPKGTDPLKACAYYAAACVKVVPLLTGRPCQVQAGSCSWPRIRPDQDDGHPATMTHFSYVWEGMTMTNALLLAGGLLPELHFWAAVLGAGGPELLDVTTGTFPARAEQAGHDWPGDPPPDFLWERPEETMKRPGGVLYQPSESAAVFANHVLRDILKSK